MKVSRALEQQYNCEKTYLLSIGDQVEHLHFHLIPKHKDKCSMGVYCFGKLWEAEGVRKLGIRSECEGARDKTYHKFPRQKVDGEPTYKYENTCEL